MSTAEALADRARESLRINPGDDAGLDVAAAAVVSLVSKWHGDADEWADHVDAGAVLLTARLWRRRQSPAGVESVGDLGAVYVQRNDPDIAMMLGVGRWQPPAVG